MTIYIVKNGICMITDPIDLLLPAMPTFDLWPCFIIGLKSNNVRYGIYCPRSMIILRIAHMSNLSPINLPWPSQTSSSGLPEIST